MRAFLPMYDLEPVREATDALWQRIAAQLSAAGIDAPATLERGIDYDEMLESPELLFGQACGYDLVIAHAGSLQVIATPIYELDGCEEKNHCSFIVVRQDDPARELAELEGRRAAVNTPTSNSGMNVLRAMIAPLTSGRFFGETTVTGSHLESIAAVKDGRADVASIDCVTFGLLGRFAASSIVGLRVLERSEPMPCPPFVASSAMAPALVAALRSALSEAIETAGDSLGLVGMAVTTAADYRSILEIDRAHARTEV